MDNVVPFPAGSIVRVRSPLHLIARGGDLSGGDTHALVEERGEFRFLSFSARGNLTPVRCRLLDGPDTLAAFSLASTASFVINPGLWVQFEEGLALEVVGAGTVDYTLIR